MIDKNIPIPKINNKYQHLLEKLKVGDSFFVKGKNTKQINGPVSLARDKFPDRIFVTRTVEGGVRIWRTL